MRRRPTRPRSPTSATVVDGSAMSPQLAQVRLHARHRHASLVAPDDTLYVSIGDNAGNNGDPKTLRAQDLDPALRQAPAPDAPTARGVPANPFYSAAAPASWRSMVYAYGFRNPFRFSLDPRSGMLHVGDVGWNTIEEVDTLRPGANAGWPCYEGHARRRPSRRTPSCKALYDAGIGAADLDLPHSGAGRVGGRRRCSTPAPPTRRCTANSCFFGDYTRRKLWTLATDTAGELTRAPEAAGFAHGRGRPGRLPRRPERRHHLRRHPQRRTCAGSSTAPATASRSPSSPRTTDPATRTVTFSAADSYDLDGDTLTYTGPSATGPPAPAWTHQHTYADAAAR